MTLWGILPLARCKRKYTPAFTDGIGEGMCSRSAGSLLEGRSHGADQCSKIEWLRDELHDPAARECVLYVGTAASARHNRFQGRPDGSQLIENILAVHSGHAPVENCNADIGIRENQIHSLPTVLRHADLPPFGPKNGGNQFQYGPVVIYHKDMADRLSRGTGSGGDW